MEKELPKNWLSIPFTDIFDINGGTQPPKAVFIDEPKEGYIRLLQIRDFGSKPVPTYIPDTGKLMTCKKDDILIARYGASIGRIVTGMEGSYNVALAKVSIPVNMNKNFVKWLLKSNLFQEPILSIQRTAQNGFNKTDLAAIYIPLPPLSEQNRIVTKLDALFAQLETIKSSMASVPLLLKDFRQQVLTQAVTGKLTEEWRKGKVFNSPNEDFVNRTLLKENKELNKIHLIEGRSKIKLNPISFINKNEINWSVFTIESLCIVIVDCLHETATFSDDGYKLIDTNNIESFRINKNKLRYVDASVYKKWVSRLKPEYGDIVYTREGTIGNALMIPENDKYCIGQRTMLFRFSKLMNEKFCELYMNSEAFKNQVKPHIKGVASQHVNIRDLRLLEMPVPSIEEQQEIVSRVESLFAKADAIEKQYKILKAEIDNLPQALLHKAFKGELTEQLDSDGDARELLKEIEVLKATTGKVKKGGKVVKEYEVKDEVLGMVAEG
jgi:type I restriction enzyme S subunit